MALTFDTINIAGTPQEVITLVGTGNTREFILKSVLTARELAVFEDIAENGVGATLKAKMEAWVLSNGRTAYSVYQSTVRVFGSYDAGLRKFLGERLSGSKVAELVLQVEQVKDIIASAESDEDKVVAISALFV